MTRVLGAEMSAPQGASLLLGKLICLGFLWQRFRISQDTQ